MNGFVVSLQSLLYKYDANLTEENREGLKKHFRVHKGIYSKVLEILNNLGELMKKYEMYDRLSEWRKISNSEF
ncbi:MAG: hypothetical protein BTN85_1670 [Candidatus Methanohalarchaeum thermophilum]|uniref:Uncharacterized protein n=1 Tax=Methanohalarchaeum thermophilum TaxID=1903181 RepID=A0A1Q6DXS9_METT1|nr:MAG: hypothetical protein BTN85_1670 [Candidatus Methanohalarchaeum thermophilum]